jgi:curved DNA-binding protein CbpA
MQAKLADERPKYSYLWMPAPSIDPYETLGVSRGASAADIRGAYHRLVQLHHPDHNNGSPESAARFEQIQEAYARVRGQRGRTPRADEARPGASADTARPRPSADEARPRPTADQARPGASADPDLEARVGDIERELRQARAARERARRAASEAAATGEGRPTDEELGRVSTDDSFAKVLADGLDQLADRLKRLRGSD